MGWTHEDEWPPPPPPPEDPEERRHAWLGYVYGAAFAVALVLALLSCEGRL